MDLDLTGRVALVTGGTKGIGRAIVASLAGAGCSIAVCARTGSDVEQAVRELRAGGTKAAGTAIDVTEPGGVERFVADSAAALGGVDLLVANVGAAVGGGLMESSPEDWATTFELNVLHAARALRASVPFMQERGGGAAVLVSSISGRKPAPKSQYGAAKAAETYLAAALARELAPKGIRVNSVSPGSIVFPGGGWERYQAREPERFAEFVERDLPAGRLGTPEEVAHVVSFLLSPRARWINGTDVAVDGAQNRPSAGGW
jgi:3-oxoacyl-[acyl-carrier protein] reductase